MAQPQSIITQQMVLTELIKAGINRDIAVDLSYRYYKNELTYKDLEYLENNFNSKIDKIEDKLKSEITSTKVELNNKIDTKFNELDNKIDKIEDRLKSEITSTKVELNNKIDTKFNELDNKIDKIEDRLKSEITSTKVELNNKIDTKFNEFDNKIDKIEDRLKSEIISTKVELNNKIDAKFNELKNTGKLHNWMFGTIITLNIGIFLALFSIIYSILNK
ncbi:BDR-repeat family protein (plasmid) [Borrelia crocidurae DOU]|uniref:BDR-repeat family protein n=1 Tax=Borrelia crocidurae DOU TaxID=1293575 RepID=W5SPQ7_9SPIR|nr:Bdr family repetitive protein [Borrelia crocidurae]AHH07091.1 BDR-repeat family protein [Borrelia crocidurae DOU]